MTTKLDFVSPEAKWVRFSLLAVGLVAMVGVTTCGSVNSTIPPALTVSRQVADVMSAEQSLTAAARLILTCYAAVRCANAASKAGMKDAYDQAYDAVTAAQTIADAGGVPDMSATTAALTKLNNLLAKLQQAQPALMPVPPLQPNT